MLLHYNPDCRHNDLPTTPLRLLCNSGRHTEALSEITRLRTLELDPMQQLVLEAQELLVLLRCGRISYAQSRVRLDEIGEVACDVLDEENIADFRSMRIGIVAHEGDRALVDRLLHQFFEGITRTPVTEGMWRLTQGWIEIHPDAAIPHYASVVSMLSSGENPCLREMAARGIAWNLCATDKRSQAVAALRHIGLPASLTPKRGEVHLDDFLVLPFT